MIAVSFWTSVALLGYGYLGFPGLMLLRGWMIRRPVTKDGHARSVSVIIAAFNEEAVIRRRLDNLLDQDYPPDRLEVIVASDGSDDATERIVAADEDPRIRLLGLPRAGKRAALNAAAEVASGDILVFTDANTHFAPDAIRELVRPFADPGVGGVAGDQRYVVAEQDPVAAGESEYWNFDRLLKVSQSRAGSVTSATGAIYAIRRDVYEPVPSGATDDFFISTAVIAAGKRLVFEANAIAEEAVAPTTSLEFKRKVRVITQGFRSVALRRALLDPRRTGFYAVQLFTHKVLRRSMAVPLLVVLVTAPLLWSRGLPYQVAVAAHVGVYGAAALGGALVRSRGTAPRVLALPLYFCMVNAACLVALANLMRRRRFDKWAPQRTSSTSAPPRSSDPGLAS